MTYSEFLNSIRVYAEPQFAAFQKKLIYTEREILGIRTPILRKLAKAYVTDIQTLLSYPDTYYETVFIQLTAVSLLPYEDFLRYLPVCLQRIDNWALCDTFKAKCIRKHKQEFLSVLKELFTENKEYYTRYVIVTLLSFYVEEEYLSLLREYIAQTDTTAYYVHMAAAWLTAEIIVKQYSAGVDILQSDILTPKTHNKAIQKAIESYRITNEQKEFLRSLKIK